MAGSSVPTSIGKSVSSMRNGISPTVISLENVWPITEKLVRHWAGGISAMLRTCKSHCIGDASRASTPHSTERSCQPKSGYRFNYDGSVTQGGECLVVGLSFHLRSSLDALEIS